jgi:DNA-binding transcriptional ArsR family regulator
MNQTKIEILKSLRERKKTVSELSKELGVTKPSVYRHLIHLTAHEFARRLENGNKFVYYCLTEKGKRYVEYISALILSLISSAIASVGVRNSSGVFSDFATPRPVPTGGIITPDTTVRTVETSPAMAAILAFIFVFVAVFFFAKLVRETEFLKDPESYP